MQATLPPTPPRSLGIGPNKDHGSQNPAHKLRRFENDIGEDEHPPHRIRKQIGTARLLQPRAEQERRDDGRTKSTEAPNEERPLRAMTKERENEPHAQKKVGQGNGPMDVKKR